MPKHVLPGRAPLDISAVASAIAYRLQPTSRPRSGDLTAFDAEAIASAVAHRLAGRRQPTAAIDADAIASAVARRLAGRGRQPTIDVDAIASAVAARLMRSGETAARGGDLPMHTEFIAADRHGTEGR